MNNDQSTPADDQPPEPTDIFLWANQADAHKDELEIDLFLFTKGYTVYATNYAKELKAQLWTSWAWRSMPGSRMPC